jgi:hypothetical protein
VASSPGYTPIITERHVPTGLTDRQQQSVIDRAVLEERERCIGVLRDEIARMDAQGGVGVGWSWQKWRTKMLAALNDIGPPR